MLEKKNGYDTCKHTMVEKGHNPRFIRSRTTGRMIEVGGSDDPFGNISDTQSLPNYDSGGLVPEDQIAHLKAGEYVIPPGKFPVWEESDDLPKYPTYESVKAKSQAKDEDRDPAPKPSRRAASDDDEPQNRTTRRGRSAPAPDDEPQASGPSRYNRRPDPPSGLDTIKPAIERMRASADEPDSAEYQAQKARDQENAKGSDQPTRGKL